MTITLYTFCKSLKILFSPFRHLSHVHRKNTKKSLNRFIRVLILVLFNILANDNIFRGTMAFHASPQWCGTKFARNRVLKVIHKSSVPKRFPTKCFLSRNGNKHNGSIRRSLGNSVHQTKDEKYQQLMSSSTLSLAPMMEYTDRHFRQLVRLISRRTLLYTEMVSSNAIAYERIESRNRISRGDPAPKPHTNSVLKQQSEIDVKKFGYDMTYLRRFIGQGQSGAPFEGPSVLQLGGSDPHILAEASSTVMELTSRGYCDYTALNLNCGCPSQKVASKGCFGAALMDDPILVRNLVTAMDAGCSGAIPVTLKCRIGTDTGYNYSKTTYDKINDEEEYASLCKFIETVASSGVVTDFQIHARIAVLNKKFSPADNRKIPNLKYEMVRKLVEKFPELTFSLNGGIQSLHGVKDQLEKCPGLKGVMVGRAWASTPWNFAMADDILYVNETAPLSFPTRPRNRLEVLQEYGQYADNQEAQWDPLKVRRFVVKAVVPLFAGEVNSKKYRIALDEIASRPKELASQGKTLMGELPLSELIVNAALETLSEEVLLRTPEESYDKLLSEKETERLSSFNISPSLKEGQSARKKETNLEKGRSFF